jgi:hypothetical protein
MMNWRRFGLESISTLRQLGVQTGSLARPHTGAVSSLSQGRDRVSSVCHI